MHCLDSHDFVWEFVWEMANFDGHFDHEDIDIRKKFYHFSRATGYQLSTVQISLRSVRYLCVPPLVNILYQKTFHLLD